MSVVSAGVRNAFPVSRFKFIKNAFYLRIVADLPKPYQQFYREWMGKEEKETPVHWIPRMEKWERNPETGEVKRIQNTPIPVSYPNEMHLGLWGGEGVVEGLVKKAKYRSPVPRFWVPKLVKTVVYSEILDKYLSVVVTDRALKLIDDHCGLDSYLLKTPAYDLKTLLALKLKRKLLLALIDKDFLHKNPKKQAELLEKYNEFIIPREQAEWYGFSVEEAQMKFQSLVKEQNKPVPLKQKLRVQCIESLKESQNNPQPEDSSQSSWKNRLNPFSKPAEAQ